MKIENRSRHEAVEFEIRRMEARILGLRGNCREEAMVAYRKLLGASREKHEYFARY